MMGLLGDLCELYVKSTFSRQDSENLELLDRYNVSITSMTILVRFNGHLGHITYTVGLGGMQGEVGVPSIRGVLNPMQELDFLQESPGSGMIFECTYNCAFKDLMSYRRVYNGTRKVPNARWLDTVRQEG